MVALADKIVWDKLKIPEKSQFDKYFKEMTKIHNGSNSEVKFRKFIQKIYDDCANFLSVSGIEIPTIINLFVYKSSEYDAYLKYHERINIRKEVPKNPAYGFIVTYKSYNIMYVNIEKLKQDTKLNFKKFLLRLVFTCIHEILHAVFPKKIEQEIHDMACEKTEEFTKIKLLEEFKSLKISDYYYNLRE